MDKNLEELAKAMFDEWEDADQYDQEGFRNAARAALSFFGFSSTPERGAGKLAVDALQAMDKALSASSVDERNRLMLIQVMPKLALALDALGVESE